MPQLIILTFDDSGRRQIKIEKEKEALRQKVDVSFNKLYFFVTDFLNNLIYINLSFHYYSKRPQQAALSGHLPPEQVGPLSALILPVIYNLISEPVLFSSLSVKKK